MNYDRHKSSQVTKFCTNLSQVSGETNRIFTGTRNSAQGSAVETLRKWLGSSGEAKVSGGLRKLLSLLEY